MSRSPTFLALVAGLLLLQHAQAESPGRDLLGHTMADGRLELQVSDGTLTLTLYSEHALDVLFTPRDGPPNPPSFAIGTVPHPPPASLVESADGLQLRTSGLQVDIRKQPLGLRFRYRGRDLVEEDCGEQTQGVGFRFRIAEQEKLFGAGSRALGRMNRRGERLDLYNSACYGYETNARLMYYSMPAIVSSRKYMLAFDNGARGRLDLDSSGDGMLRFDAVGGRRAYVLIAGDSWQALAAHVADMTGHQPLLPRWAMGSIASRMAYHTREEVESVVARYRADGIPLDAIVLDLFWFGPTIFGTMGDLDWDRRAFPEPEEMMAHLRREGVKTILVTEPLILKTSKNWAGAVAHKALATDADGRPQTFTSFFGEAGLLDVFKPAAREWFWNFYRRHTESGVAGWWGDLGEPETHPDDIRHAIGRGEDVHNLFGHAWAGLIHEGFQRDLPGRRPFILMRAGFVGTQRYGILPWSGDVNRTWGGLKPQVELALQMGLQGVAYMHSDLGGFAGDLRDPELYIRWLQYGAFQPIYRPHGHENVPPEPIYWDEATRSIVRRYIRLRYQLLPYNYTLMFENVTAGLPLMRPLMFLDDRPEMEDCMDTYLWGDALLIAPILEPGLRERRVTLPEGPAWFDLWSGRRHEGGQMVTVPVTLENIPVFARAGSFIPMIESLQSTDWYDPSHLSVHVYADASVSDSSGQLYDDDGVSAGSVEQERYELLRFRYRRSADGSIVLRLEGDRHEYSGRPERRFIRFVVHALGQKPAAVEVDGQAVDVRGTGDGDSGPAAWDDADGCLTVIVEWTGRARDISILAPAAR